MDIVERLRKFSAPVGGGAFYPREMAKEAADEIEQLREALRFMLNNDRNLQKPLEELVAEFCIEAREALGEKE